MSKDDAKYERTYLLHQNLLKALISGGIDSIVNVAYEYLRHPIIVVDSEYNPIIQIPNEPVGDFVWDAIYSSKSMPHDIVELFSDENLIKKGYEANKPLYVNWGAFKESSRVLSNVTVGKSIVGYMAVLYFNEICTKEDINDIELINQVMSIELQRTNASNYEIQDMRTLFLINLLDGKINNKEELDYWKTKYKFDISGNYQVLSTRSKKGNDDASSYPYIKKSIERFYPKLHVAVFGDNLYILISDIQNQKDYDLDLYKILKFLTNYNLKIGLSNSFSNIIDTCIYKEQANFILNNILTSSELNFCFYQDYALDEMLQVITKNMHKQSFIHPAIQTICNYDKENKSDLYKTLSYYILSMKDVSKTLEYLHIHRNTLPYRIKIIERITSIDLSDNKTCAHLFLNFSILNQNK